MRLLVVNADDFGRSHDINQGIIEAHENGMVTSASLMVTGAAFEEAVQRVRAYPRLGIGLHLDLDRFFHVQHGVGRLGGYKDSEAPLQAVVEETERQIKTLMHTGLPVDHLDSHHHSHLRPELLVTIAALASKYRIGVIRFVEGFYSAYYPGYAAAGLKEIIGRLGLKFPSAFFGGWNASISDIPGVPPFDLHASFEAAELMTHPGLGEEWRERELRSACDPEERKKVESAGIRLARFSEAYA